MGTIPAWMQTHRNHTLFWYNTGMDAPHPPYLADHVEENFPNEIALDMELEKLKVARAQLKIIKAPSERFTEAARDIFALRTNLKHWQDDRLLTEGNVRSFQNNLVRINGEVRRDIDLKCQKPMSPEEKGMAVLDECNSRGRNTRIANVNFPERTAEGMLQVLANDRKLGWRDDWQEVLSRRMDWEDE